MSDKFFQLIRKVELEDDMKTVRFYTYSDEVYVFDDTKITDNNNMKTIVRYSDITRKFSQELELQGNKMVLTKPTRMGSGFFIVVGDYVVLNIRSPHSYTEPLKLSMFGGHINLGETPLNTALRELAEELTLYSKKDKVLMVLNDKLDYTDYIKKLNSIGYQIYDIVNIKDKLDIVKVKSASHYYYYIDDELKEDNYSTIDYKVKSNSFDMVFFGKLNIDPSDVIPLHNEVGKEFAFMGDIKVVESIDPDYFAVGIKNGFTRMIEAYLHDNGDEKVFIDFNSETTYRKDI